MPEVIFATFGDAMRVPGTKKSMLQARAEGADIRIVYSPLDALELARRNPEKEVVFFALGFETTTRLLPYQSNKRRVKGSKISQSFATILPYLLP